MKRTAKEVAPMPIESARLGAIRGQWQCTQADDNRPYEMYAWNRNKCGVTIYEYISVGRHKFMIAGNGDFIPTWKEAVEKAIVENNRRVNLAKAWLRDNDYCD